MFFLPAEYLCETKGTYECFCPDHRLFHRRAVGARGPWFDYDWDVTEQAGPPSEERCHNVATTGVDSGGLTGTGEHDRPAGT